MIREIKVSLFIQLIFLLTIFFSEVSESNTQEKNFGTANDLIKYAGDHIYIDESRRQFFERHHNIISKLLNGELVRKNRFRELLLGSKSVGKTILLKILAEYTKNNTSNLLVVDIRYNLHNWRILKVAIKVILENYPQYKEFSNIDLTDLMSQQIEKFEELLVKYNLKLLLLVDEFQFVYNLPYAIGTEIVHEIAALSDSNNGLNHMIVSGSSTFLRKLVFAKLLVNEQTPFQYPSFERKDLNSTKLQPHWIFPIVDWSDAKYFCERFLEINNPEQILKRFILGGGRPGLMIFNTNDIPYTIDPSSLLQGDTVESKIIHALYDCVEPHFRTSKSDEEDFCACLRHVSTDTVYSRLQGIDNSITNEQFRSKTFDLADSGAITFHGGQYSNLGFSSIYTFLAAQMSRNKLTWTEVVALKLRNRPFSSLAEEVVLRIIHHNH